MARFLETFMYREEAFLVDEVIRMDPDRRSIGARLDTRRELPFADRQRTSAIHPAHVSGPELIMVTASLGCLHAWFFHGCRWADGWVGFGSRIHSAEFRKLGRRGPPLELESREVRSRSTPRRVIIRYAFRFHQEGALVYASEQSAMFVREPAAGLRDSAG